MSSQVVRVQGFSKGSLSGIGNEAERGNVNHRNPDIDPERKHMNMPIKTTEHGFYAEWNRIKTDLNAQGKETKKGIAFEGMVITAEAKFFEERFGWVKGEPMSPELVQYWHECYEWAVKEIGYQGTDKNIISAVVHADETSLHLQLYYVPITERWQEKVYAKDEDGHVLRNAKGSPIQAKDENGKTIYRQVEDLTAPKLSRTEFWRVRGGQTSYSQMQDRFHEEIGKKYGLERGEVGSNAKHRTKAQWEAEQLQEQFTAEKAKLSEEKDRLSAEVQPYRELKAGIDEIDSTGKTLPFGYVAVKKESFAVMQEQAKSYTANRDEIETLRERSAAVSQREQRADQREKALDKRESGLEDMQNQIIERYNRQLHLNRLLEQSERECADLKKKNGTLTAENGSLRAELAKVRKTLTEQIEALKNRLRGAYESLTNVVKAVGMLKYDREKDQNGNYTYGKYGISYLSKAQDKLIDGLAVYGAKLAKEDGFPEMAEDMEKRVGISKGIEKIIEPQAPKRSRGYEMEL